jgi:hypothetical protein
MNPNFTDGPSVADMIKIPNEQADQLSLKQQFVDRAKALSNGRGRGQSDNWYMAAIHYAAAA